MVRYSGKINRSNKHGTVSDESELGTSKQKITKEVITCKYFNKMWLLNGLHLKIKQTVCAEI